MARESDGGQTGPRYGKAVELVRLVQRLATSTVGLSMDEMVEATGRGRRTVERMLAAIEDWQGPLRTTWDDGRKRWSLPRDGVSGWVTAPTTSELIELQHAAAALATTAQGRAEQLRTLADKVAASLKTGDRARLAPDLEGLMRSEAIALRPGPEAAVPSSVLDVLRHALLAGRAVRMQYGTNGGEAQGREVEVVPYGILFGVRGYLVGARVGKPDPVLWRLDRIRTPTLGGPAAPPPDFDLGAYAGRSFSTFQEEPREIVLRFVPRAANDARSFRFHPTQIHEAMADGSLRVRFRCGGLLQIAHHLVTWGDTVRIEQPEELRTTMADMLEQSRTALVD